MGARQKLNRANLLGSVLLAAVAGWTAGSWPVFFVTMAILVAGNVYAGEIRMARRNRTHK